MIVEHRKSPWINFFFFVSDLVMTIFAALASLVLREILPWGGQAVLPAGYYLPFIALLVPVLLMTMLFSGQYRYNRGISILLEFMSILRLVFLAVIAMLALAFFYREYQFSRLQIVYFFFVAVIAIFVGRMVLRLLLRRARSRGRNLMHVVVLGPSAQIASFVRELHSVPGYGYSIDARFSFNGRGGKKYDKEKLQAFLAGKRIDEGYLMMGGDGASGDLIREALGVFEKEGIRVRLIPDLFTSIATGARIGLLGNIPVLAVAEYPLDLWHNQLVKRVFDICVSGLGLIASAPLLLVIAVLIRISSKGPILFRQTRLGLDRAEFRMLKFRTMRVQSREKSDTVWTTRADPRVTRLGRFLRRSSLDELPQLFNVLKGEMSIVGPRPERPYFVNEFKKKMPLYMKRHRVKAGLTGWAQVNNLRGDSSIERRLQADLHYIRNWTLGFDIRIFLLTAIRMVSGRNAY